MSEPTGTPVNSLSDADRYLLDAIERGDEDGWSQLVQRYQGRLLAFARQKVRHAADAEDLVQDTFLGFLRGHDAFRGQASIETYLFTILRRRIVDQFRGRRVESCALSELNTGSSGGGEEGRAVEPAGSTPTASWYARRDEQRERRQAALAAALGEVVEHYRRSLNFRDLQVLEMLFYCQLRNKAIAEHAGVTENHVALIKHRCLSRVRERAAELLGEAVGESSGAEGARDDSLLTEVWEAQRPSCPKRSTIGAYLLGTLEPGWRDYVRFHIETLGCRFCRANLDDLKQQTAEPQRDALRDRIMQSTVGFLKRSG